MTEWHWWFAWRPVSTVDERLTWLRVVKRRRRYLPWWIHCVGGSGYWEYERDDGYVNCRCSRGPR
jgi:hypothetical protein